MAANFTHMRRKRARLERIGRLTIEHVTEPETIANALPVLFEQHLARWIELLEQIRLD
jgi:hypothetical protein